MSLAFWSKKKLMAITKNDLVELRNNPSRYDGLDMDWDHGIVVRGPYEDSITLSSISMNPINVVSLVCDIFADGKLYKAIPLELLVRSQKRPGASP
jgi:hypothetical protein